ncbi:hypothetical protein ASPCADRAFT_202598 [Aspergillus carbonarius ITEM 5010]|uniref:Uncharacterized protein n=1 Tax=Aspergillus carbonarius (strain ITEM 5010) TaxID=602072 RepID=A0A1R3S212_ASPC5|nr:hypothetical protein ASPCADRAFT_202598 [Aspergillus carbonarius ITEM 5010]
MRFEIQRTSRSPETERFRHGSDVSRHLPHIYRMRISRQGGLRTKSRMREAVGSGLGCG